MQKEGTYTFSFDRAFRTWETQSGYPVIHVKYDAAAKAFHLTQERFFEFKKANSGDNSSWYIPINFATQASYNFADTKPTHFFVDGESSLHIPVENVESSQWFVFNKQGIGYYRVNYDEANWRTLEYLLSNGDYQQIHVMNRAQLIEDSFALAKGNYIDYEIAYNILKYLVREDDFFPWYTAYRYINPLRTAFGTKHPVMNVILIYFF
jgi:aminopeptidase N